jgi:hypothetical protein
MKGDAYGGRLKGVNEDFVGFVGGLDWERPKGSVLGSESEGSPSDSALEDPGSWRKRIAAGSTEIMSPGARRVLASVC